MSFLPALILVVLIAVAVLSLICRRLCCKSETGPAPPSTCQQVAPCVPVEPESELEPQSQSEPQPELRLEPQPEPLPDEASAPVTLEQEAREDPATPYGVKEAGDVGESEDPET